MDQAFLDYYSLEPFTQWIHRTLCGVMPEDWAVFIEGLALGIVILLAYAVLAVVLIYMERRVCGAFQCRIGPNRVGGKGGLLQVPADVLKILTKEIIRLRKSDHVLYELAPYLVILASVISFSCLPWHKGAEILDMQIGIFFVLAASSIGVIGILLAGWSSNSKYTIIGAVRSGAMIISYELSLGITVLTMVILSGTMSISGIVESQVGGWNIFRGHVLTLPYGIFRHAFRLFLLGRVPEPFHYGRYCHYAFLRGVDAFACGRARRVQCRDGLCSRYRMVPGQDVFRHIPVDVDPVDLPPFAYRPGADVGMEIPHALVARSHVGHGGDEGFRIGFLKR